MTTNATGVVQRVDGEFSKEVLKAQDGKKVPLTLENGGPVIGEATLRYDEGQQALLADFRVDDPKMEEFLRGAPPSIFGG